MSAELSESSDKFSEQPAHLRGQIAGLQQMCAVLINKFVPFEERGGIKTGPSSDDLRQSGP